VEHFFPNKLRKAHQFDNNNVFQIRNCNFSKIISGLSKSNKYYTKKHCWRHRRHFVCASNDPISVVLPFLSSDHFLAPASRFVDV